MPNCCEPCNNPTPSSFQEVIVPAGGSLTVPIPITVNPADGTGRISCIVIDRNAQDVDAVLTPDRDENPIDCTLIQPGDNPVEPWGPFVNPGVITVPTYADDLILCNSGDDDVTVLVQFFEGCGCYELCDPNANVSDVNIVNSIPIEVTDFPATPALIAPADLVTSAAGATTEGLAEVSVSNVGDNPGTWNGISLLAGASISYRAYLDPETNVFNRIAAIAYDATGTTFLISETP